MTARQACCTINSLTHQLEECHNALEECQASLGEPPPVLIAHINDQASATNPKITAPIDTTGADFIVINVGRWQPPTTPTDSFGNIYTLIGSQAMGAVEESMYICFSPVVGPNHTFSAAYINAPSVSIVAAFSWAGAKQGFVSAAVIGTTLGAGPLTTVSESTLFVTATANMWSAVPTVTEGFVMIDEVPFNSGNNAMGGSMAYKVVDGPATVNPIWNGPNSVNVTAMTLMLNATVPVDPLDVELQALEHWDLKAGPDSLKGMLYSKPLTPVAAVTWQPDSVLLPKDQPGVKNGMLTGFDITAQRTFIAVVKRPPGTASIAELIFGTDLAATGLGIGAAAANPGQISMILTGVGSHPFAWPAGIAVGDWCFVVLEAKAGYGFAMVGGGPIVQAAGSPFLANSTIMAVGNGYATAAGWNAALEVAEVIVFDGPLTESALNQVYGRSQARMLKKGIDIRPAAITAFSINLIASTSKGTSAGGGHTDPIDTTGATMIVLNLGYYNLGSLTGVHDSQGNTYLPLTPHVDVASGAVQQLWYCQNPVTGPAHQFQINGATIFASVQAAAFDGDFAVSSFDQETGALGTGLTLTVGPVSQTTPESLVIAGVAFSDSTPGPVTSDNGFTTIGITPYIFGQHFGSAMSFKVSDSVVLHTSTWDLGAPMSGIAAGLATFKRT